MAQKDNYTKTTVILLYKIEYNNKIIHKLQFCKKKNYNFVFQIAQITQNI